MLNRPPTEAFGGLTYGWLGSRPYTRGFVFIRILSNSLKDPSLMNQNLDLLRQNSCRPVVVNGKGTHDFFPLEKECEQGKILLAKAPKMLLPAQDFNPYGLRQTYLEGGTGLELPVFAVFDLEGEHRLVYEITTDSINIGAEPGSLSSYLPLHTTQASVRTINKERAIAESALIGKSFVLGIIFGILCFLFGLNFAPSFAMAGLAGGWASGTVLTYALSRFILDRRCPWKKLILTAEFDGILPKEVREKARNAKSHFDKLYLIVDQQHCWKSVLLPDPRPRPLDPLLVAELKENGRRKFFLIDRFDLTAAEQYLADELLLRPTKRYF
jgi:hypothetical protein